MDGAVQWNILWIKSTVDREEKDFLIMFLSSSLRLHFFAIYIDWRISFQDKMFFKM